MKFQVLRWEECDTFYFESPKKWTLRIHFYILRFWRWKLGLDSMEAKTSDLYWLDLPSISATFRVRKSFIGKTNKL